MIMNYYKYYSITFKSKATFCIFLLHRWFFGGINRLKAEDYLQFDANVQGAYLIRSCEKKDSNYCLSLKSWKNEEHQWVYKHYLILQNEKKTQFWIKGAKE